MKKSTGAFISVGIWASVSTIWAFRAQSGDFVSFLVMSATMVFAAIRLGQGFKYAMKESLEEHAASQEAEKFSEN